MPARDWVISCDNIVPYPQAAVAHITDIMRGDLAVMELDRPATQTYAEQLAAGQALLVAV